MAVAIIVTGVVLLGMCARSVSRYYRRVKRPDATITRLWLCPTSIETMVLDYCIIAKYVRHTRVESTKEKTTVQCYYVPTAQRFCT